MSHNLTPADLAWNVVHAPCEAPAHYVERHAHIADLGRRQFAGMLSSLDETLPLIVGALKEKGMWQNTIFIVTTDNGGNLGGSGNNYPLRCVCARARVYVCARLEW